MTNDPADPRNDPNMVRIPFLFVKRGDPPPLRWMAEHPGYFKVPAIMVPHGSPPPWPWGGARARPAETVQQPASTVEPRIPGSFVPPPARRRRTPGGQPWPKDKNGRDWPKDRWGRPMRPLWDYPPGVRAPGEGVAPGEPGSVSTADAIAAYLRTEAMFADPVGMARAVSAPLDPATLRTILASGHTGTDTGGAQALQRGVASRYPGAYDVAQARQSEEDGRGVRQAHLTPAQQAAIAAAAQDWSNSKVPYVKSGTTIEGADCSGAVYGIYRQASINIKHMWSGEFPKSPQFSPVTGEPEVGDVGWYLGHVVIYGGTTGLNRDVWSASRQGGPAFGPANSSWYGTPHWYRYNGTQQ
jgi:cell wall-associated NlpC family hydrolase